MVSKNNIKKFLPLMCFVHFNCVVLTNHLGGLVALGGNGNIHAFVLIEEPQAIQMLVHNLEKAQNSVISRVYAFSRNRDKNSFGGLLLEVSYPSMQRIYKSMVIWLPRENEYVRTLCTKDSIELYLGETSL